MRRRGRGFSLLEIMVSLAVVAVVLTLATRLIVEVQLAAVEWRRTLRDPMPQLTTQLLRTDIQRSSRLLSAVSLEPAGTMALELPGGRQILYAKESNRLTRSLIAVDGEEIGSRTVMSPISLWRWRHLGSGLIQVEITYQLHRDPGSRRLGGTGRLRAGLPSTELLRMRFALRATPGRQSW